MFKGVNVCVYVGEGLRRSFATPDPFVLTNKICLNQKLSPLIYQSLKFACFNLPKLIHTRKTIKHNGKEL